VDRYDGKAADEMRRRHAKPEGGDGSDGYWSYSGETEATMPE
jgi:hypothetical protein